MLGVHVERLYRAAYGLCGSRADAEDLVQDTYERVLRRPRFVRRDDDLAYLLRVLRNTWVSFKRVGRAVTIAPVGDDIEAMSPSHDPISDHLEGDAVFEALQELTDPLREALVAVDVVEPIVHLIRIPEQMVTPIVTELRRHGSSAPAGPRPSPKPSI